MPLPSPSPSLSSFQQDALELKGFKSALKPAAVNNMKMEKTSVFVNKGTLTELDDYNFDTAISQYKQPWFIKL